MELTYTERGLSDPEHQADRTGSETHREVRTDAQTLSERTSFDSLESADSDGTAVSASEGNRRNGAPETGRDDAGDGTAGGRDRGTETQRPDDLRRNDEQSENTGRGNLDDGFGVQLSELEPSLQQNTEPEIATFQQLTLDMLFPTEQEQITRIDEADRTQPVQSAFLYPMQKWMIYSALAVIPIMPDSKLRMPL